MNIELNYDVLIVFMKIDIGSVLAFEKLLFLVSEEKSLLIRRLRSNIDKYLSLYAEILVVYLAQKFLNISIDCISFGRNKYGKSFLKKYPNFQFNISHTKNAILVGVSDKPIGVDIEKINDFNLKIVNRFFMDFEKEYIFNSVDKAKSFYEIWTRKEAHIKWLGRGMSVPLKSFDVMSDNLKYAINTCTINQYVISFQSEYRDNYKFIEITESELNAKILGL